MKYCTRILAAGLAALLAALCCTACHKKNETVMTVGDTAIPSGLYLAFELEAFNELMSGVNEELQESSDASQITDYADYFNYDYENQSAEEYVRTRAKAMAVEYAVVQAKYKEFGLELAKADTDYIDSYAQYYWESNAKDVYEPNGVSFATYQSVITFQVMRSHLFSYYYDEPDEETGKGGVQQVPDKELTEELANSYLLADSLAVSLTPESTSEAALTDDQIKAAKAKLDDYAKRINSGDATFAEVYKEQNGSEPQENTSLTSGDVKTIYPATATVLSSEDQDTTRYELFQKQTEADGFTYGKAVVFGGEDDGAYYLAIFYQIEKDPYYLQNYRAALLYSLRNDAFTTLLADEGKKLTQTADDGLINYYKPTNIHISDASAA